MERNGYQVFSAATLEDLRQELNRLHADGENLYLQWNGFDDGSIYCHDRNGNRMCFDPDI